MSLDVFVQYFSNGEWLANFLTSFVAIFVPLISLMANIIGKYKNSVGKALQEFKDKYGDKLDEDFNELKLKYAELEANLKTMQDKISEVSINTEKTLACTNIAYQNSNLAPSVKNEITKVANASVVSENAVNEANDNIKENEELDKVEAPATLEEIANEVADNGNLEQDNIVL